MKDEIEIPGKHHQFLNDNHFGVLSTIRKKDSLISSNPVGYFWDGVHIKVSTLKSRVKYLNLEADNRIAFCIISSTNILDYIEIRGYAALADDPDRELFKQQFKRGSGGQEPPEDVDSPNEERAIITVLPQKLSRPELYGGRFEPTSQNPSE